MKVAGKGRSFARNSLPALVGGVGLALSVPPWGFWILAFPAAAIIWWRLGGGFDKKPPRFRTRLWIGWLAGIGLYGPGLFWATSFSSYGGVILILLESLALGAACAVCGNGMGRLIALPAAMVLGEYLRDIWPFGGLPLGGVALGQVAGPMAYAARIGGPLLLTGLLWLAGAGLGSVVSAGLSKKKAQNLKATIPGLMAIAVVVAVSIWGGLSADGGPVIHQVRVAAVQGGGVRGLRKAQVSPEVVYNAQLQATSKLSDPKYAFGSNSAGGKDLIVWPEDVVSLPGPLVGTETQTQLAQIARKFDSTLLVGVTYTATPTTFRNEVVAFAPSGAIVGTYEKVHRVPFGEYVPYRGFFEHFANLSAVPQDAIPGTRPGYIDTPSAPVGLMVSYEVFFAASGRSATRAGAQLLVVPTNTSSYSTGQVPTQEVAAARLQAIEEGRDLIQVAPTGYSAIITNDGQVLQRSVLGKQQVLVGTVSLRDGKTIYERAGDLPVLIVSLILLVAGWAIDLKERRSSVQS